MSRAQNLKPSAFTVLEMFWVVGIVTVLALVLLPALPGLGGNHDHHTSRYGPAQAANAAWSAPVLERKEAVARDQAQAKSHSAAVGAKDPDSTSTQAAGPAGSPPPSRSLMFRSSAVLYLCFLLLLTMCLLLVLATIALHHRFGQPARPKARTCCDAGSEIS